jgi:hypothetical protein
VSILCQLNADITPTVSGHDLDADAGFIVNTIVFAIVFIIIIIIIIIIIMTADIDPAMA